MGCGARCYFDEALGPNCPKCGEKAQKLIKTFPNRLLKCYECHDARMLFSAILK
jgi:uncharacterized Zn finger protein